MTKREKKYVQRKKRFAKWKRIIVDCNRYGWLDGHNTPGCMVPVELAKDIIFGNYVFTYEK